MLAFEPCAAAAASFIFWTFLLVLRMRLRLRGLKLRCGRKGLCGSSADSVGHWSLFASPLDVEAAAAWALERRLSPSEGIGSFESCRNARNMSLIWVLSFAEHSKILARRRGSSQKSHSAASSFVTALFSSARSDLFPTTTIGTSWKSGFWSRISYKSNYISLMMNVHKYHNQMHVRFKINAAQNIS